MILTYIGSIVHIEVISDKFTDVLALYTVASRR
jgi:hypothetical protein